MQDDVEAVRRIGVTPIILDTVCRLTGMGFAAVARVTDERWIACDVLDKIDFGLRPGGELELRTTICHEIRESGTPVIISDVETDPHFVDHHTPAQYKFRSYISMPIIRADRSIFGTLCAIDPEARDLERPEIQATFRMFADLLAFHLDAADRLTASENRLAAELATGELREQFIAVLGHDLRNPLASFGAGLRMLERTDDVARASTIRERMGQSLQRMTLLIDNILDFARGRLGGGLTLKRRVVEMEPLVRQVVAEFAMMNTGHSIEVDCPSMPIAVNCDPQRIEQLLSNLIGNAITHGTPGEPIRVRCVSEDGLFSASVSNGGEAISEAARAQLFSPFKRGAASGGQDGLGLGLYIASEIAKAHGGTLSVVSTDAETMFTFSMPLTTSDG